MAKVVRSEILECEMCKYLIYIYSKSQHENQEIYTYLYTLL